MVKSMTAKAAKQKALKIYPDMAGHIDRKPATLAYNKVTVRYDLKINDELCLSHLNHAACLHRAGEKGATWEASA